MRLNKVILFFALITLFVAYLSGNFFNQEVTDFLYFKGIALSFMLLAIYVKITKYNKTMANVFLIGAFNNLVDELFFDPFTLGLNELILLIVVLIYWVYNAIRNTTTNN